MTLWQVVGKVRELLRRPVVVRLALHAAAAAFVLGLFLPAFSLTRLWLFTDTYSIVSGIYALLAQGDVLLVVVVTLFSVVFPAYKLYLLYRASYTRDRQSVRAALALVEKAAKWSMLDVFVVAVLVTSLKDMTLAGIEVHGGLYAFGASVLLTMAVASGLRHPSE